MTGAHDGEASKAGACRPAHRRSASRTRTALRAAAAFRFGKYGYEGTSVRDIAGDVGVDAALVYRYFGSKEALFNDVTGTDKIFEPLLREPVETIPDWFCALLLGAPKDGDFPHPVLSVLRSSGRDEAVARLRADFTEVFTKRLASRLGGPDADLRAELLAAWMLGTSLMRTEIRPPALLSAPDAALERYLRAGIEVLLGPAPQPDAETSEAGNGQCDTEEH
ncbi:MULTISPECIES: TetR/AcrR family transcriptional regulator [Streptomyces]|uniref:TetR/AcrR family transcriptional regulator n=1 Tax=Streptomyces TaxID=1883 RepID=UPI00166FC808|nr:MULTISPECIES: TetR/AcrR family transcriptional regulator [Streptomyces]UFR00275.1 TetR family transcriptional regulator [Streptomyces sp. Go40/10]GGS81201.1 TetR family transcriptional regulator [Streptomyces cinerochromogenes]